MFDVRFAYPYCQVGSHSGITKGRKYVQHLNIYRFRTEQYPYLMEVEKYESDIYFIKFYRRKHKGNKNRFNYLSGEYRCSRIIATCFRVFLDIFEKNPFASLGFLGSNTIIEPTNFIEPKKLTKRFLIYRQAVLNNFGEKTFTHFEDYKHSVYLAISNQNSSVLAVKDSADIILSDLIEQVED